jgi:dimethylargininase
MDFKKAIVKTPCRNLINGLTTSDLGPPVYEKALDQHAAYIEALQSCGIEVIIIEPDEDFPDSTFVEDTALLTDNCSVVTNPGAMSRRGEIAAIAEELKNHYRNLDYIQEPGTIDAGDILMVENHFYIGMSERTNVSGCDQMIAILSGHGYSASTISISEMLHLKSGIAYLGNNSLLVTGELVGNPEFGSFDKLIVPDNEQYAANCLSINNKVIIAKNHPATKELINSAGYTTVELDMSEFQKIDGGISCLSLRF